MSARVNTPDAKGIEAGKKLREHYKPNIHRQTTVGAPGQQEQGGTKKKGKGHQVTGKAKILKNIKGCFKRDTPGGFKTRKERKGQDIDKRPNTGTTGKQRQEKTKRVQIPNFSWGTRAQEEQTTSTERKSAESKTSPTIKEKEDNRGREAQQEDAESQTSRHGPQHQEALGPRRKDTPPAQTTKPGEPHRAKASPAAQVRQQGKEHAPETRTTHTHPKDEDGNKAP